MRPYTRSFDCILRGRRTPLRLLVLPVILVGMCRPACAQELPGGVDPDFSVQPLHYLLAGENPAMTRLALHQFDVRGPGKAIERKHRAITIFAPNGRDRGRVVIYYDGIRRIRRLAGRIRSADGRVVRKLNKNDVQDYSAISDFSLYEDNRVRVAELLHDEYPYTVEFEIEIRHDGLLNWPDWYPQLHGDAVEYGALEITAPVDLPVRHASRNLSLEPAIRVSDNTRTYSWSVQKLDPFETEEFGPGLLEQVGSVHTAPERFEIEGTYGDMSSWEAFGRWYATLGQGANDLSPAALADVRRLTAGIEDDREKARQVYAYLQERTRYVSVQLGLGGWKPYPASYVHERRYGDCKALSNYLIAMLKAVGITAYTALIRNGRGAPDVLPEFPSNQFNHAIVFVPLAADTLWLEATSQTIPFGHIGAGNEDRYALVVGETGGELIRTPQSQPEDNRQDRRGVIQVLADGSADADVVISYSGNQQDRLRGALARSNSKKRNEWLLRRLDLPQFDVRRADFSDVDGGGRTTITLPLGLRLPRYAARAGSRLFLTPVLMDRWDVVPPAVEDRTQDVAYFSYAFLDTDTYDYELPDGYAVEAMPDSVYLEESFGRFEAAAELLSDGTLRYVRRFEISETRLPPDEYDSFRNFLSHVARSDRAQVVLVRD